MPGISLHFSFKKIEDGLQRRFHSILKDMCHLPVYHSEIYLEDEHLLIGVTGYDAYPVKRMRIGQHQVFFEGCVYDSSELELRNKLTGVCTAFTDERNSEEQLAKIIYSEFCHADCEFWVVMYDIFRSRILIFNDSLGHLPLYYHQDSYGLTISREIKFVRRLKKLYELDRDGMAQVLLLKYPLGNRTLSQKIKRLPYAALLTASGTHPNSQLTRYQRWNLQEFPEDRSADYYLDQTVERFRAILKNREELNPENHPLLALSGGLDSRAVLAGLLNYGLNPIPASSLAASGQNRRDVEIAQKISLALNLEFNRIELKAPEFEDFQNIVYLKDGLNNVVMSSALGLYESLSRKFPYGSHLYTGDGGITIKTCYRKADRINSERQILKYVFDTNAVFQPNMVENLLALSLSDSKLEFLNRMNNCPAENWSERYFYHIIFEYLTNHGFEGQDRTRYYYWLQAPFEAIPFYTYALRIPDKFKANLKLISAFIDKLQPELLKFNYADYNASVDSFRTRASLRAKTILQNHPILINALRKALFSHRYKASSSSKLFLNQILDIIQHSQLIPEVFNKDYLIRIIEKSDLIQYLALMTVLLYINQVETEMNSGK